VLDTGYLILDTGHLIKSSITIIQDPASGIFTDLGFYYEHKINSKGFRKLYLRCTN